MLKRHRNEITAAQKAGARLGKKREAEAQALVNEVNARHARELAELDARPAGGAEAQEPAPAEAAAAPVAAAVAELASASLDPAPAKPSKAQKAREKKKREEAEREARIEAELAAAGPSSRALEEDALSAKLAPLGLAVVDIRADGHCLYRSLEDQLCRELGAPGGPPPAGCDFQSLRSRAAAYMRAHPDDYTPYLELEGEGGFESYCAEVEGSAAWGGQLELGALAHALRRRITVYSAHLPTVEMGQEYRDGALRVAYQLHAFGLGEHFNSVRESC